MKNKKQIGTMNIILIIIGVATVLFTKKMISLFEQYGAVPDTLITCWFMAVGGECGIMGMIQKTKEKIRERKYFEEDRDYEQSRNRDQ